jgi:hypothetical protein
LTKTLLQQKQPSITGINISKSIVVVLVLIFLMASCIIDVKIAWISASESSSAELAENSWVPKAPMQVARSCLGVVAVNRKIYAIGGSNESGFLPSLPSSDVSWFLSDRFVGTNEEYDPAKDTWTYKNPMPTPRIVFAITVYQNKIYCIGGKTNNGLTGVNEVYDPETDTWETKTPMPTPRGWLKANVLNERIYLAGGFPNSTLNEVYNPETDSWNTKNPAPAPLIFGFNSAASAVFNNRIYFIGGVSQDYHYNLNQIYDAETDEWSSGASPPSSVSGGVAVATTGFLAPEQIYVLGCSSYLRQGESQTFVRVYDPENDSWTFGTDVLTKRNSFGAAIVNDTLYTIGGYTYSWLPGNYAPIAVNEQYIPFGYGTIPQPSIQEPFPTILVAAAAVAVAVAGAGLLVYFRKRNH